MRIFARDQAYAPEGHTKKTTTENNGDILGFYAFH